MLKKRSAIDNIVNKIKHRELYNIQPYRKTIEKVNAINYGEKK